MTTTSLAFAVGALGALVPLSALAEPASDDTAARTDAAPPLRRVGLALGVGTLALSPDGAAASRNFTLETLAARVRVTETFEVELTLTHGDERDVRPSDGQRALFDIDLGARYHLHPAGRWDVIGSARLGGLQVNTSAVDSSAPQQERVMAGAVLMHMTAGAGLAAQWRWGHWTAETEARLATTLVGPSWPGETEYSVANRVVTWTLAAMYSI